MDPVQRRAVRNGIVAFAVTALIGFGINALVIRGDEAAGRRASSTGPPSASPTCTSTWEPVDTVDPDRSGSQLVAVTALSPSDVWAVGSTGDPQEPSNTLVEHWDGNRWRRVDTPNGGTMGNALVAVDGTGRKDAWAVGSASDGAGYQPLILHWDGSTWETALAPNLLGGAELSGVIALSPTDAWAVGHRGDPTVGSDRALVLHWNGSNWTEAQIEASGGRSSLVAVDGTAADDLWAVGYHQKRSAIMHGDGKRWRWVDLKPRGRLLDVTVAAPDQVWAVGSSILRWNGSRWKPGGTIGSTAELNAVSEPSTAGLWAVGDRVAGKKTRAIVRRFDGTRWSSVEGSGVPGSESLGGVSALPDGVAWGVGYRETKGGRRTLAARMVLTCR
ncbi:MAG TPA: hypothetical protein VE646_10055 [Actinomycetota bacterium]|jgi:hypothetical protein|nr:hypothetical protein [Actinomycetota bacterium]